MGMLYLRLYAFDRPGKAYQNIEKREKYYKNKLLEVLQVERDQRREDETSHVY